MTWKFYFKRAAAAIGGPEEVTWFARLDDEQDNLRTAVEWALGHNQPGFIFRADLYEYWKQRRHQREPLAWLERAVSMAGDGLPLEHARAMKVAGNLLTDLGENPRARRYYESALNLFRQAGDPDGIGRCLNNLGNMEKEEKHYERARQLYEESLVGAPAVSFGTSLCFINLGDLARIRGDWQASLDYYLRSPREICIRLGAEAGISYADAGLCILALVQRDLDGARENFGRYLKASWLSAFPYHAILDGFLGYVNLLAGLKIDAQPILNLAMEDLEELLDQNPYFPEGCFLLDGKARLVLENGQAESATQLFGGGLDPTRRKSLSSHRSGTPGL